MTDDMELEIDLAPTEEVLLEDLDKIQQTQLVLPAAQGVRVKIEKASVKKALSDGSKDAPAEGPNNPLGYKYLNLNLRMLDGISVPVIGEDGLPTGETEEKFKNKVLFPNKMDLIFTHNPEVKTSAWWKDRQYIFGFKQLCLALGMDLKQIRVNDDFLESLVGREILVDIVQEENNTKNEAGAWVGSGTFKNRIKNFKAWE